MTESNKLVMKKRADVIDTFLLQRDEIWALKWLIAIFFVTLIYEFAPQILSYNAPSNLEIKPNQLTEMRRPLPIKRIAKLVVELKKLQLIYPVVRTEIRKDIAELEQLCNLRTGETIQPDREKLTIARLERLFALFSRPTWEKPELFTPLLNEIRAVFMAIKHQLPETSDIPQLPIVTTEIKYIELPSRDIFSYAEKVGSAAE